MPVRRRCRLRFPIRSDNRVRIRPEYYERLRSIAGVAGGEVSITAYVDRVLEAHFEDNEAAIASLYVGQPKSRRNLLRR